MAAKQFFLELTTMDPEDPSQEEFTPQTEGEGGAAGKPPKPTAVGTGGSGFDDSGIGRLRRYDLDEEHNPDEFISWTVPNLTFVRINDIDRRPLTVVPDTDDLDEYGLPERRYAMEGVITGLHSLKANICSLMLSDKKASHRYFGASIHSAERDCEQTIYNTLKSMLYESEKANVHQQPVSAEQIEETISRANKYAGIVTGIPAFCPARNVTQSEQIANGLDGHAYGMLVLAVPVPKQLVTTEQFSISDQIARIRDNDHPQKKRQAKYYLELQEAYLKHVQLGTEIGMWLVGCYFFADDLSTFARIKSLLTATYDQGNNRPTPFRTTSALAGLSDHIARFGLLQNRRTEESTFQSLMAWKWLTPLNSRFLSAYIHVPRDKL